MTDKDPYEARPVEFALTATGAMNGVVMKLIKQETKEHLRREEVAQHLREVADELARHNELPFVRDGVHYTVAVPDDLVYELEIEVKEAKSEIKIKLKW